MSTQRLSLLGECPENLLIKEDFVQSWLVFGCVCGGELAFWGSPKAPQVSGLKQQVLLISLSVLTLRGQKSRCQQSHLHIPYRLLGNLCPQHSWSLAPRPPSVSFACDSASVLTGLPRGLSVAVTHIRGCPTPGTSSKPNVCRDVTFKYYIHCPGM